MIRATITVTAATKEARGQALRAALNALCDDKDYALLNGTDWTATVSQHGEPVREDRS